MPDLDLRATLVLLAGLSLTGCTLAGQRAGSGHCPAGETCSSLTPDGLFFLGTQTSDSIIQGGVFATAAGGTQTITVHTDSATDGPTFEGDFTAATADSKVFTVDQTKPPTVLVRGQGQGLAFLRLLEPGTSELLDRVQLQVEPIESASLLPLDITFTAMGAQDVPWAVLAGVDTPLVVMLHGTDGNRLVDEAATLTPSGGPATRKAWDLFSVNMPAPGAATFSIGAGGATFSTGGQVVSAIDDITTSSILDLSMNMDPTQLELGKEELVCFLAQAGGVPVGGAKWNFTLSTGVTIDLKENIPVWPSCVALKGTAAGPTKITAEASGFKKTFDFVVGAAKQKRAAPARRPSFASAGAGERAALVMGAAELP